MNLTFFGLLMLPFFWLFQYFFYDILRSLLGFKEYSTEVFTYNSQKNKIQSKEEKHQYNCGGPTRSNITGKITDDQYDRKHKT